MLNTLVLVIYNPGRPLEHIISRDVAIGVIIKLEGQGGVVKRGQDTNKVYTCQREGCDKKADYKLVHKRFDSLFQYLCDEHLNDEIGHLMREEYIPIEIPRGSSSG